MDINTYYIYNTIYKYFGRNVVKYHNNGHSQLKIQ